jgi:predicted dithiol-disulfide oxidoreductase (DUF899 family)
MANPRATGTPRKMKNPLNAVKRVWKTTRNAAIAKRKALEANEKRLRQMRNTPGGLKIDKANYGKYMPKGK